MDEDLYVLLLVVHQLLEAVLDDVFKGDPSGDELERIDFSARDHLDRGAMVVRIPEASQELHLPEQRSFIATDASWPQIATFTQVPPTRVD